MRQSLLADGTAVGWEEGSEGKNGNGTHTLLTNLCTMLPIRMLLEAFAGTEVDVWPGCERDSEASPMGFGLLCMIVLLENVGVRPLSVES